MIDWEQEIEMKWNNANRKWFLSKGYEFTKWGDTFMIKAKDLNQNSTYKIKYMCDNCGEEIETSLRAYNMKKSSSDLCIKCGVKIYKRNTRRDMAILMREKLLNQAKKFNYEIEFDIDNYDGNTSLFTYICPIHGKGKISCANFIRGHGCKKCQTDLIRNINKLKKEEIIQIIESKNGNKLLNPDDYIKNSVCNLLVQCGCGETFYTSIAKYNKKFRCKKCVKSESQGELRVKQYLEKNNIPFIQQYKYADCKDKKCLPFDFKIDNHDICIEFDGQNHYLPIHGEESLKKTQYHDEIKNNYCKDHNIKLIRIPYWHGHMIDEILTNELLIM